MATSQYAKRSDGAAAIGSSVRQQAIEKAGFMIERRAARSSYRKVSHDGTVVRRTPPPERRAAVLPASECDDWIAGEPTLRDLQQDPLIHAILRRDGLSLQDLLQAMAEGRRRLEPRGAAAAASGAG